MIYTIFLCTIAGFCQRPLPADVVFSSPQSCIRTMVHIFGPGTLKDGRLYQGTNRAEWYECAGRPGWTPAR